MSDAKQRPESVTSGEYLAPIRVRVSEGTTIIHDDKPYHEGDIVEIPARTADHLAIAGQVEAVTDE